VGINSQVTVFVRACVYVCVKLLTESIRLKMHAAKPCLLKVRKGGQTWEMVGDKEFSWLLRLSKYQ
jgi:hypothetical protein